MSHRITATLVAIAVTATFGLSRTASGFSHRGIIVDASTKKPIRDVLAVAATSNKLAEKGDCPKYDGFVGQASSKSDGSFTIRIADTVPAYFVTYCRARYETFTPGEQNENTKDSTSILPAPVRLWPLNGEGTTMRSALQFLRDDTREAVIALQRGNPASFAAATKLLPEPDQQLVEEWVTTTGAHLEQQATNAALLPVLATKQLAEPLSVEKLSVQLRRALTSQHTTLSYFETASPEHYHAQLAHFPDLQRYVDLQAPRQAPRVQPTPPPPTEPWTAPWTPSPSVQPPSTVCGSPRADVGAAVDSAAAKLFKNEPPHITSISALLQVEQPSDVSNATPRMDSESHLVRVVGVVANVSLANNHDLRLILIEGDNAILVVVPYDCIAGSALRFERLYAQLAALPPLLHRVVEVEGFLFFPTRTSPEPGTAPRELRIARLCVLASDYYRLWDLRNTLWCSDEVTRTPRAMGPNTPVE